MTQTKTRNQRENDAPDSYVIFPDYWKEEWGEKPVLGFVSAYSKFEAIRQAYTRKLLTKNFTFEPEPIKVDKKDLKKYKSRMYRQKRFRR